jgi:uncharacterized protein HemX
MEEILFMSQYTYFILGILLGLGIAIYFYSSREERIQKRITMDKKIYSTKRLDNAMERVVEKINEKIKQVKRELTEDEKNEIIAQCCKEKFYI